MNRPAPPTCGTLERKLIVRLSHSDYEALEAAASDDHRKPSSYARLIIQRALGLAA